MRDPSAESLEHQYDNPLERLQLLGSDDAAIAAFLDEIDVRGPRDREMLRELARPAPLARPERFESDHWCLGCATAARDALARALTSSR